MDKYQIIENKITNYFQKKATELNLEFNDLSIIITNQNNKLYYILYCGNKTVAYQKLDEILNLNILEKAFASTSKVETTLNNAINKIVPEQNCDRNNIQLLLKSNKSYSVLKNFIKIKDINLTEIL